MDGTERVIIGSPERAGQYPGDGLEDAPNMISERRFRTSERSQLVKRRNAVRDEEPDTTNSILDFQGEGDDDGIDVDAIQARR